MGVFRVPQWRVSGVFPVENNDKCRSWKVKHETNLASNRLWEACTKPFVVDAQRCCPTQCSVRLCFFRAPHFVAIVARMKSGRGPHPRLARTKAEQDLGCTTTWYALNTTNGGFLDVSVHHGCMFTATAKSFTFARGSCAYPC